MILGLANYYHFLRCHFKKTPQRGNNCIQKNVIISLTTTPKRIHKIWPTLNSLAMQSQQPEKILLWIPKHFKRFRNESISRLPHFFQNYPSVQVEFIDHDYGPASKLLPSLELFAGQDTKIIIVDDDRIYPIHFIRDLLKYEQFDPGAALGIAGTVMHGAMRCEYTSTKKMALVDVLLGYNGVLVKPKFFSKEIFNYPTHLPEAFFEDDVWFSGHLQKNKIRRVLIPSLAGWQSLILGNKRSMGLCMHENKDKSNFNRVFEYLFQR